MSIPRTFSLGADWFIHSLRYGGNEAAFTAAYNTNLKGIKALLEAIKAARQKRGDMEIRRHCSEWELVFVFSSFQFPTLELLDYRIFLFMIFMFSYLARQFLEWFAIVSDHVIRHARRLLIPPRVGNVTSRTLGHPAERAELTIPMPWDAMGPRHPMLTEEAWHAGSWPLFPGKATHVLPFPIWPAATINFSREVFFLSFLVFLFFFHHTISPRHINSSCLSFYVILSLRPLSPTAMFKTLPYLDVPQGTLYLFFQILCLVSQLSPTLCPQLVYKISCIKLFSRIRFPLDLFLNFFIQMRSLDSTSDFHCFAYFIDFPTWYVSPEVNSL